MYLLRCLLPILVLYSLSVTVLSVAQNTPTSTPPTTQAAEKEIKRLRIEGELAFNNNDFARAAKEWQAALEKAQATHTKPDVLASVHNNLGLAYLNLNDYQQGIVHARKAITLYEQLKDQQGIIDNLFNLGHALIHLERYPEAENAYQEAFSVATQWRNPVYLAKANNNLGYIYWAKNEYRRALPYFQKALGFKGTPGAEQPTTNAQYNLGLSYYELEESDEAIKAANLALPLYHNLRDSDGEAQCYNLLGMIYSDLKQFDEALRNYKNAQSIFEHKSDLPSCAMVYTNLGNLLDDNGQPREALEFLDRAVAIKRKGQNPFTLALSLQDRAGILEESTQYTRALRDLEEALSLLSAVPKSLEYALVLKTKGDIYIRMGQPDQAEPLLEKALQIYESINNQMFSPSEVGLFQARYYLSIYAIRAAVLTSHAHFVEALSTLERGRAQGLARQAAQNNVFPPTTLTSYTADKLQQQLAEHNPDTLYLQYAIVDDYYTVALALSAKGVQGTVLFVGRKTLEKLTQQWRTEIAAFENSNGLKQAEESAARALYDALILPLQKSRMLGSARHLVIVADGPLWSIPFAALLDRNGQRLITHYSLSKAISFSSLLWPAPPAPDRARMLAVADPFGAKQQIVHNVHNANLGGNDPLPQSRRQVQNLVERYSGALGLFGTEARKDTVKQLMPQFDVLNFAIHGEFNDRNGLASRLILADGSYEARDIAASHLKAAMAALWACNSEMGRISGGDGMVGLCWAFRAAGCPSMVASLWAVKDDATALLISRFFEALDKGMPKDDALQFAMNTARQHTEFSAVYYWAGFEVLGSTAPINLTSHSTHR